ncbi:hypothetical protein [Actinospica sp.]|uniref:hypothetical protein n=1 Tax=Actinospica sp. TaxID=1872142 RepID=UPI002CAB3368|nr:hypothetical protein [Actinospica sp.]HWG25152.1 hypothetical protein [Actinospica sp.]
MGTGYVVVTDSNWLTICWAFDRPVVSPAPALAAAEELAAAGELELELLLELQAASTAAAVIAAPGASQRFHLCVIAFGSSIPPITSGA